MPEYKSPSFEKSTFEITSALSTLKRHGLNVELPKNLVKKFDATTLFDGDDGLFKELIKLANVAIETFNTGRDIANIFRFGDRDKELVEKFQITDTGEITRGEAVPGAKDGGMVNVHDGEVILNPIQQQQFGGGMTNEQAQMMGKTIASNLNFNTQITNGQLNVVLDGGLG